MWVRHSLLQEMQNSHPLCRMGLKKHQEWVGNGLTPSSQENRTPRLLSPSTLPLGILGGVFGAPHGSGILQGSRWDGRNFGGDLWAMCKDLGLETSRLREELKPKSLFGFSSSGPEESHGQPCPSRWQEKLWSISRCGERSYPFLHLVWGRKPHANPPGSLQDPTGCFGVCSCSKCPKDAGRAGGKADVRTMPLMPSGAGK